jgi:hypothetical protein
VIWAELVFHVLAHTRVSAPASAYDETWIDFVEKHAGPARERPLGEDAIAIARAAPDHDALAAVQMLAWLFATNERATACSDRTLDELTAADVDDVDALRVVQRHSIAAEVLRAAAELEAEVMSTLPPLTVLDPVPPVAPWVEGYDVKHLRPLRLRGRVFRKQILVGVPSIELGPSAEHVAWQTAHEATVSRLHHAAIQAKVPITHHALEHAAITMLQEHAERTGKRDEHAKWLAHFANVPSGPLPNEWRALVQSMIAR